MIRLSPMSSKCYRRQWVPPAVCPSACCRASVALAPLRNAWLSHSSSERPTWRSSDGWLQRAQSRARTSHDSAAPFLTPPFSPTPAAALPWRARTFVKTGLCWSARSVTVTVAWRETLSATLARQPAAGVGEVRAALPSDWLNCCASHRCLEFPPTSSVLWHSLSHYTLKVLHAHQRKKKKKEKDHSATKQTQTDFFGA